MTDEPKPTTDDLSSDKGVDYTRLRDLLKAGKWQEADEETLTVMLRVAGREQQGSLDSDSMAKFPSTDLQAIDQLWVKYSSGRFGFSVQKKIWLEVGKEWGAFCKRVEWQRETYIFNPYEGLPLPEGHLPIVYGSEYYLEDKIPGDWKPDYWLIRNSWGGEEYMPKREVKGWDKELIIWRDWIMMVKRDCVESLLSRPDL